MTSHHSRLLQKDNVTMRIDTVVFFQITDPKLFCYGVENPIMAIENLTATTLRNIIGDLELDQTLTSRETINTKMRATLDEATDPWGIKVNRVELKNIIPPAAIQDAMEKQMKAERERREQILKAEGEKKSAILIAEGNKQSVILEAEAEKQSQILRAEAKKGSNDSGSRRSGAGNSRCTAGKCRQYPSLKRIRTFQSGSYNQESGSVRKGCRWQVNKNYYSIRYSGCRRTCNFADRACKNDK